MELLSFITMLLTILLIPTFFISIINPRLVKLDSRKKSLKIHLMLASIFFITSIISIAISDRPNKNTTKPIAQATAQQDMNDLGENAKETAEDEIPSNDDGNPDGSNFVENDISAKELSVQEFIDRINNILEINDVSLELEEVDEEQTGNLITYKVESDDKEISCSVYSNKISDKIISMLCFVKHSMRDKESEKAVANIVVSFVQTIFDVTDRIKIEKVIPMFENRETIKSRSFKELGTHFEIYHHLQDNKDQSVVFINVEPAERTDSEGNSVSLQFITVSK